MKAEIVKQATIGEERVAAVVRGATVDCRWNTITSSDVSLTSFLRPPKLSSGFKGILHQKIFYCLYLIFWIVKNCPQGF